MLGRRADRIALGVRRHECRSHVVFYVPDESGVNIARVLHARMDAPRQYVRGKRWRLAEANLSSGHLDQQALESLPLGGRPTSCGD